VKRSGSRLDGPWSYLLPLLGAGARKWGPSILDQHEQLPAHGLSKRAEALAHHYQPPARPIPSRLVSSRPLFPTALIAANNTFSALATAQPTLLRPRKV
jgi:hypothetical protein